MLNEQDRSHWDHALIVEGASFVERALSSGGFGPYNAPGAVAAVSCRGDERGRDGLGRELYDILLRHDASPPVVALNRAVAVAMRDPEAGLSLIDALLARGELKDYQFARRVRICVASWEEWRRRGQRTRALHLAKQEPEHRFLERRVATLNH